MTTEKKNEIQKPLCFVLMPFGQKPDASGKLIDFDAIYDDMIRPAIENVGLECIRADEERAGGIIHKAMYERLLLCEYAVADLTTANANVFYELGVRHAVRPSTTALIFAEKSQLPFDVNMLRALPYKLDDSGKLADLETDRQNLVKQLDVLKTEEAYKDSPLFQLFDELKPPELSHEKTDIFRDRVAYSQDIKEQLYDARKDGLQAVKDMETKLGDIKDIESGILIDLLLSYRGAKGWQEMIDLVDKMPPHLSKRVMIREQLAFALNRAGKPDKAEKVLRQLIDDHGPSSETYGLLGRIYKDFWDNARKAGEKAKASAYLKKAIKTYTKGFEADWRDFYPGINAVTLLDVKDPQNETDAAKKNELLPVVAYAVKQKIARGKADYWDWATLLELAVLGDQKEKALEYVGECLINTRETWEPETTARNLNLIKESRQNRGVDAAWIEDVINELMQKVEERASGGPPGALRGPSGGAYAASAKGRRPLDPL